MPPAPEPSPRQSLPRRAPPPRALSGLCSLVVAVGVLGTTDRAAAQVITEEVRTVRFEGNETFPEDSLARAIVTQETDCRTFALFLPCWLGMDFSLRRSQLRTRELPLDRARLTIWYQRRGFREVQVDTAVVTRRPGRADVVFRIAEGRPVLAESIGFEGADDIAAAGLLDDLPLRVGERLSTLARDATRDTLTQRLRNQGYAHADVFAQVLLPAENPYAAQVTFDIAPGPVSTYGAINITGTENLSQRTILRTLQFNTGDRYRDADIDAARARLFGLDIIRSARIQPDLENVGSVVDVDVTIQEGDAYRVRYGVGWSTAECLNLEARWTSRNFLGGGRLLQVRGRLGNLGAQRFGDVLCNDSGSGPFAEPTWITSVDLAQPWVFSTDNSLSTSVFAERQTLPDIFIRRAIGFQAALTRTIDARTLLTLVYRPELSELDADDVLYCTGFLVCTPGDIAVLEGANWLAPIGVVVTRDRSDDLLNPRNGYRVTVDFEHAAGWTGSNFRYDRAAAEATAYSEVADPIVLASRLRAGWVGRGAFDALLEAGQDVSIVHPQRRFYAGGANSVRGFAQARLGPRVLITEPEELLSSIGPGCTPESIMDLSCDAGVGQNGVAFNALPTGGTRVLEGNVEVRATLGARLEAVAFTDFGQAWGPDQRVDAGDIEFTPGFGLRFPSPVGPIRVDLAYRFRGSEDLSVITPQLRAFVPGSDDPMDQIVVGGVRYVQTNELALLDPMVSFLDSESRLQLHVSIGQAF